MPSFRIATALCKEGPHMTEYWLAAIAPIIAVLVFCLAAHKQNREADKQGGRNHASAQIGFGRNSFRKEPEELYTEDRKINREWKQ